MFALKAYQYNIKILLLAQFLTFVLKIKLTVLYYRINLDAVFSQSKVTQLLISRI